ncbi:MAG: ParB/RepB/Spo0J family partition protein [Candidatus Nitrosotenuis sp.]
MTVEDKPELRSIPIDQLELWEEANVRKSEVLLNIEDLAGNIKRYGVQVPLLVKEKTPKAKYLIFSGQRRFEAAKLAGLEKIPCFIFREITLTEAKILSFSENLYREGMTMEDKSHAANELYKKFKDMEKVARALGVKDVQTVRRYLRYDDIPEELRKFAKKEHGGLSSTEIENIFFKFPDLDRAIAVAKKLASLKKGTKQRRKFHESVRISQPSDDVQTVSKRAEKLIQLQTFKIILPDTKSKTLEKIAFVRKITVEELLNEIIDRWLDEYLSGRSS